MADRDEIFDSEGQEPVLTTEGVSPEAPAAEGPARDEQGRFKAKGDGAEPEPPAETPAEPEPAEEAAPPAAETKDRHIPITALLDEREKRQRIEAEAETLRRQLAQLQQPQKPPEIPDAVTDPEEFAGYLMRQQAAMIDNLEAQFSEREARREYGDEAVDAALAAARQTGEVRHFVTGPDRWGRMVKWHQERQALAEIGSDPAAYRDRLREEIAAELREQIKAEILGSNPSRPKPPPSLASAQSSGAIPHGAEVIDPLFE